MKKQYIIVYENSYDKLEERVSEAMEQGYKPHGNLVFRPRQLKEGYEDVNEYDKVAFIQAMVLKN